jgi:hypothetical protein
MTSPYKSFNHKGFLQLIFSHGSNAACSSDEELVYVKEQGLVVHLIYSAQHDDIYFEGIVAPCGH